VDYNRTENLRGFVESGRGLGSQARWAYDGAYKNQRKSKDYLLVEEGQYLTEGIC